MSRSIVRRRKPDPIVGIIEGHLINAGIKKTQLAKEALIPYSTFCYKMRNPGDFRRDELKRIFSVLQLTDEDKKRIPW